MVDEFWTNVDRVLANHRRLHFRYSVNVAPNKRMEIKEMYEQKQDKDIKDIKNESEKETEGLAEDASSNLMREALSELGDEKKPPERTTFSGIVLGALELIGNSGSVKGNKHKDKDDIKSGTVDSEPADAHPIADDAVVAAVGRKVLSADDAKDKESEGDTGKK